MPIGFSETATCRSCRLELCFAPPFLKKEMAMAASSNVKEQIILLRRYHELGKSSLQKAPKRTDYGKSENGQSRRAFPKST